MLDLCPFSSLHMVDCRQQNSRLQIYIQQAQIYIQQSQICIFNPANIMEVEKNFSTSMQIYNSINTNIYLTITNIYATSKKYMQA